MGRPCAFSLSAMDRPSFPKNSVVYYWTGGFLLLASSFVVDRGERPT